MSRGKEQRVDRKRVRVVMAIFSFRKIIIRFVSRHKSKEQRVERKRARVTELRVQ